MKYIKPKGYRGYMCAHFVNMLTNGSWVGGIAYDAVTAMQNLSKTPNVSAICGSIAIAIGIWLHINSFRINIYTNKLKLSIASEHKMGNAFLFAHLFVQFINFVSSSLPHPLLSCVCCCHFTRINRLIKCWWSFSCTAEGKKAFTRGFIWYEIR